MTLSILFGLASAFSWGVGDFAGGLAARRSSVIATLVGGQTVGLIGALILLVLTRESAPPVLALAFAGLAGLSGVVGLASLYRALAIGPMGLVAPAVAVLGAGLPAVVGVARGDDLRPVQMAGLVAALVAVTIASRPLDEPATATALPADVGRSASLWLIALAGTGFAGFYLLMNEATAAGAQLWWPVTAARIASLIAVIGVAIALRHAVVAPRAQAPLLVAAGLGDLGGNAFFVLANAEGPLSIAAVVSSLYPVTTVLLARLTLGERLGRVQLVGVGLALVGIVLISI